MYCDFIAGYDCKDINSISLFEVFLDGLYCLFDEGFINDIQLDNLLDSWKKIKEKTL